MTHEEFVVRIVSAVDKNGRVKARERNDLEYKKSFGKNSWAAYAKTMASFANNRGGYILFGIKDNPREIVGVNNAFRTFEQAELTNSLNTLFSPAIEWECGLVEFEDFSIGYIYTYEAAQKPIMAVRHENSEKINNGDVFFRYRARSEKIRYPEMVRIIEDRAKEEQERIIRLMEAIRRSGTTNLGIVNYSNGKFSTPYGTDIMVDKKLVVQVLKKAKYIKQGSFDETKGIPVLKVTGNIDLAEEIPVPDIEPDIQYPYIQKQLAQKLNISPQQLYSLIWFFDMKGKKKYHMAISTSTTGSQKTHKFSDVALQFLAEKINENKDNPNWLNDLRERFNHRNDEPKEN